MDDKIDKFDELSKALASGVSRRQALKIFGASVAGALVVPWAVNKAEAEGKPTQPPHLNKTHLHCGHVCHSFKGMKKKACMKACHQCERAAGTLCTPIPSTGVGLCCSGTTPHCGIASTVTVCTA